MAILASILAQVWADLPLAVSVRHRGENMKSDHRWRPREGRAIHTRSEERDGMRIDWHVPIEMDDGNVLDADFYRPVDDGAYPVILSHGLYAKGLSFQDEIYAMQWERLVTRAPSILDGSTNRYQSWEVVDPERWVLSLPRVHPTWPR